MKDLMLDEDGDLLIRNGDFVIGESLEQDAETIMGLTTNQLKWNPTLAPNLIRFMRGENLAGAKRAIETSFSRDRKKAKNIKFRGGKITLTPMYK